MTSTLPPGRDTALCWLRAWLMKPTGVHVPVAGSYTSAEDRVPERSL
ncbi:MAG TPA: hypothetical protein VEU33_16550 [Archangium sp.]|nr:hypothetical protein [Archangium sp.]